MDDKGASQQVVVDLGRMLDNVSIDLRYFLDRICLSQSTGLIQRSGIKPQVPVTILVVYRHSPDGVMPLGRRLRQLCSLSFERP